MTGFLAPRTDAAPRPRTPAPRPRAPAPLGLVQDLVNTADLEAGTDQLSSPSALRDWLGLHELPRPRRVTTAVLGRVVELREAIRDSLAANAHSARPGSSARLEVAARSAPLRLAGGPGGPRLVALGGPLDRAVGVILAAIAEASAAGLWPRLKVCRNDACRWAYRDGSKNRSGVWCTMAVCGNRAKGARFRRQARGSGNQPARSRMIR